MKYIAVLDSENEFTEKVIEALKDTGFVGDNPRYAFVIDDIQERKVGKWVKNEHTFWTCTECGFNRVQYAYCPNCGADMRDSENDTKTSYKGI